MPIVHDGDVVGAIGVSGASSADEDQELARARCASASGHPGERQRPRRSSPRDTLRATFATGGLLLDTPRYKIDAGRRASPARSSFTTRVVDVMHVVEGPRPSSRAA